MDSNDNAGLVHESHTNPVVVVKDSYGSPAQHLNASCGSLHDAACYLNDKTLVRLTYYYIVLDNES
jgi:hypothetical protein